jgi:outer membrane autotransporter protein
MRKALLMPKLPLDPRARILRLVASSLLAGTSIAALLLAAPAQAGQTITNQTVATVTNPAGNATTSIVITGSTVTGAVTNAGTISPGKPGGFSGFATLAISVTNSTIGAGIANTGTISASGAQSATGIFVNGSIVAGGITNAGTISAGQGSFGEGIFVIGSTISGGIANTGMITVSGGERAIGIAVLNSNVLGGISNSGMINASGGLGFGIGIAIQSTTTSGGIANTGTISTNRSGIAVDNSTISGGITNSGTINAGHFGFLITGVATGRNNISGGIANSGAITINGSGFASGIGIDLSTITGGIANSGTITVSVSAVPSVLANGQHVSDGSAFGIDVARGVSLSNGLTNTGRISVNLSGASVGSGSVADGILIESGKTGGQAVNTSVSGGVSNSGTIAVSAPGARAVGILVGRVATQTSFGGTVSGGITNSGTITASGKTGIGIALVGGATVSGGITNTGTIMGSTAAIDVSGEGGPTTITQSAGALLGSVVGSGNANADVLNFTGGRIVLSPTQSISGLGTYNQTGGTLVLQVTQSTAAGTFATVSAGTVNLRGGTFELAPQGNIFAFASTSTTFKDIISATNALSGNFANVTSTFGSLFGVTLTTDATTPNALDATLALNPAALAASAQDLTQDARLGLDAPRVLTQAVQDRLVASGGALGEGAAVGAGQKGVAGFSFGNANIWARSADQFGSATAPSLGAGVGYDINRAAPFIAGIDWRLDNGIVAGVAATYVATSAKFKDGSSTNASSYQGAAYAGWAGGPWYALGSVVASFNELGTSRMLTPFGLPADATSSPSGQSYEGHAEAGYHWGVPAAGMNVSVTPYAALDYVNAHLQGFSETGGFGALSVNATDANSFQTTLGVRLTSRIAIGNYGVLTPELRLGWNHEFLDASQKITASLVGVTGSGFSATGVVFGRDAALLGAGFSMELSPDAKVFVDYDGRLGSRLQEHSISGGLKVRF